MDVIPQTEDGFEAIENGIVLEKVKSLVKEVLDETEKDVIELRYGLIDGNSMTQAQVAKHLNISRSYVSRIEKRAIEKVSEALL